MQIIRQYKNFSIDPYSENYYTLLHYFILPNARQFYPETDLVWPDLFNGVYVSQRGCITTGSAGKSCQGVFETQTPEVPFPAF